MVSIGGQLFTKLLGGVGGERHGAWDYCSHTGNIYTLD